MKMVTKFVLQKTRSTFIYDKIVFLSGHILRTFSAEYIKSVSRLFTILNTLKKKNRKTKYIFMDKHRLMYTAIWLRPIDLINRYRYM